MSSSSRTVSVAYLAYDCAQTFRLSQPELSREKYISYAASLSAARILFIAKYFFLFVTFFNKLKCERNSVMKCWRKRNKWTCRGEKLKKNLIEQIRECQWHVREQNKLEHSMRSHCAIFTTYVSIGIIRGDELGDRSESTRKSFHRQ